jgi:diadenosine tetraphosphate (Ap4A) HIT family hydrolase
MITNCVFCKIVTGQIPSAKTWEDENFLAILDINPNTKGMTLVLTKAHYDSYVFEMPDEVHQQLWLAVKKVARLLEKALGVQRVAAVMEGMGVNHAHIKLYPLYGLEKEFEETWAKDKIFLDKYPGYVSTQLGPPADSSELEKLAQEIRKYA